MYRRLLRACTWVAWRTDQQARASCAVRFRPWFETGLKYDLWLMTFEGVYSVLPTPFTDRGDLDEASLRRVVDLFIEKGVNGLTALGVTGEVARLEDGERARVLEVVVAQAAGRVPIVAGTWPKERGRA